MVEHGRQGLDDDALARVTDALGRTIDHLTRSQSQPTSTRPWLRAYSDASKKAVDRYVADTETAIEAFDALRLRQIPEALPYFDDDGNDEDAIEDFAGEVRHAVGWWMGTWSATAPLAPNASACSCYPCTMNSAATWASRRVATPPDDQGQQATPRPGRHRQPLRARQRFTVAYELGHLSLHATTSPPATGEQARLV